MATGTRFTRTRTSPSRRYCGGDGATDSIRSQTAVRPGPTHLALNELDGALETLTADLGRAMEAGVISLPDWFTRFASLEAIAVGDRVTG